MLGNYDGGGQPAMGGRAPASAGGSSATGGGTYYAPPSDLVEAQQQYAQQNDAYKRALIRFNQQRTGLLRQYGYQGDIDPESGMVKNLRVDGGNMYGGLQQLLHNQALEDEQAKYAAEDRGISGGLAHQAESELAYGHHGQTSALANSLFDNLSGLDNQQLDAKSALDNALWQLTHMASQQAVDNGDFNPGTTEDPGPSGDGGGGGGSSAANPRAATVAKIVGTPAQIAQASMAAKTAAQKAGQSAPAVALAARSAGLNAAYGLGSQATHYYTYKADAQKAAKKGQTVKFSAGRGYYLD